MLWRQDPLQSRGGFPSGPGGAPTGPPHATQPHWQPRPMGNAPGARYEHVATEEAIGRASGAGAAVSREGAGTAWRQAPRELAKWQTGGQRLALRQHFNVKEIHVADIVRRYDIDRSRVLEPGEVRRLLQDYNGGRPPREEELGFIMKIADKNHDQRISQEEVMFALRTWYAFNHMPKSVGHALGKYGFGGGPLPSTQAMQRFLLTLNEQQPVSEEEAAFVRAVAAHLSGSEGYVSLEHLRQAVAAWYLNVERGDTPQVELLGKAVADAHSRVFGAVQLKNVTLLFKGDCDYTARGTLGLGVVMLVVLVALPCLEILMANSFPSSWKCEYPHLSSLVWGTGVLGLLLALAVFGAIAATHFKMGQVQVFLWVFAASVSAILVAVTMMGASNVLYSSGARCGLAIWHFAHLVWIEVPFLVLTFMFCGLPVLYFYFGSQEFIKNQKLDASLMKP